MLNGFSIYTPAPVPTPELEVLDVRYRVVDPTGPVVALNENYFVVLDVQADGAMAALARFLNKA